MDKTTARWGEYNQLVDSGFVSCRNTATVNGMPELCRFYGIIVSMNLNDHAPPHFHVRYNEYEAMIEISDGKVSAGELPNRAQKLVEEWRELHRNELEEAWELASQMKLPMKILPLP